MSDYVIILRFYSAHIYACHRFDTGLLFFRLCLWRSKKNKTETTKLPGQTGTLVHMLIGERWQFGSQEVTALCGENQINLRRDWILNLTVAALLTREGKWHRATTTRSQLNFYNWLIWWPKTILMSSLRVYKYLSRRSKNSLWHTISTICRGLNRNGKRWSRCGEIFISLWRKSLLSSFIFHAICFAVCFLNSPF